MELLGQFEQLGWRGMVLLNREVRKEMGAVWRDEEGKGRGKRDLVSWNNLLTIYDLM